MSYLKYLGLFLLIIGLLIILLTLYYSYNLFVRGDKTLEIFKKIEVEVEKGDDNKEISTIENQINQMIKKEIKDIIPEENINRLFNLISWSIFSFIFIFGGAKLSEIGIRIIKN